MHPPKHEVFDLADRTNTDPKGFVTAYTYDPHMADRKRVAKGKRVCLGGPGI